MDKRLEQGFRFRRKPYVTKQGFSFIELLTVVVIIALILGISLFGLQNARDSNRDTQRLADMEKIKSGLTRFYADCGQYPSNTKFTALTAGSTLTGDTTISPGCIATNKYIVDFPVDPEPGISYAYSRVDNANYVLCAALKTAPSPAQDVSGCGSCGTRTCNVKYKN